MKLDYDEMTYYTGDVYEVIVSVYEDENPCFEEGCVEDLFFDNAQEAKEAWKNIYLTKDLHDYFDGYSYEEGFDTVGLFLLCRSMVDGRFADTYFTDDIVDMYTVKR